MSNVRYSLATFQGRAVEALSGVVQKVAEIHENNPSHRQEIGLKSGVSLLEAPTGSGKTLVLGRTLEDLRGRLSRPTVWFWFAPYSGLVAQTRAALSDQCRSLQLRDITKDREPVGSRDSDVFIQTWSAVAANEKDARRVRRSREDALSLDEMIAELRDNGYFLGVVIDEAHVNFGPAAPAAAEFYLKHLKPDFTFLATATPNDQKLEQFEREAGIEVASRVIVPRGDVVKAGLNKKGLMLGVIRTDEEVRDLIDLEKATLTAGWTQHNRVKKRLNERGIRLTPLMLVQVEDQIKGGEDPVARVRKRLLEIGVPDAAIATHTSGQPDPDFHTLAYDPEKEVLIFKVAVATGFDAPRAWTLVSVRPNRGVEFGMQIVGRIMRVHSLVRPFHGEDSLLDRGYVFLTDPKMQSGLDAAVEEIKAVRQSIELITDRLDILDYTNTTKPLLARDSVKVGAYEVAPVTRENRQSRLDNLIENGWIIQNASTLPTSSKDLLIKSLESIRQATQTPLFDDLPEYQGESSARLVSTKTTAKTYTLRKDLSIPAALWRELPPDHSKMNELIEDIAKEFCKNSDLMKWLTITKTNATATLRDLFNQVVSEEIKLRLHLSNARVAQKAQLAFEFNESIDPRLLKRALLEELRREAFEQGSDAKETDLRRAIDLAVMKDPNKLKDAMKIAQGRNARLSNAEPIPKVFSGPGDLGKAKKSAYGVFPENLNKEEQALAELLDEDKSGTVQWWLRNKENTNWAARLLLPSGKVFFPDFAVGVKGRSSTDSIALIEIKDDGDTGRLQSDRNLEKIRVQHRKYNKVFWTYRLPERVWVKAEYSDGLNRIVASEKYEVVQMIYT